MTRAYIIFKGIVQPKNNSVINYTPSCWSKTIRPSFIFWTQIKIFSMSFLTLHWEQCNWNVPRPRNVVRTSVHPLHVPSVVQHSFYETTRILFVCEENKSNDGILILYSVLSRVPLHVNNTCVWCCWCKTRMRWAVFMCSSDLFFNLPLSSLYSFEQCLKVGIMCSTSCVYLPL